MSRLRKLFIFLVLFFGLLIVFFIALSYQKIPEKINYGVSFSRFRAEDLGLDWKDIYLKTLDDLGVRKFRLSAYWNITEPEKDSFDFSDTDFQTDEARKRGAEVIFAVGRRLPGWPECHVPMWAKDMSWEDQKKEILSYIEQVVLRYKDYENIKYWQVENEPFLSLFAFEECGALDEDFLAEEINLVKRLDNTRKVVVTDSGNLGLWYKAWKAGDVFGTSIYIYLWNPELGQIRTIYTPSVYRAKAHLMDLFFGRKENFLSELSLEPWLIGPTIESPLDVQIARMGIDKFRESVEFAKKTGFSEQYLWGVEWWYWMDSLGYPEYLENARKLFKN